MARLLRDTTVLIDISRGRSAAGRVEAALRAGEEIVVSAISVEEFVRGLRPGEEDRFESLVRSVLILPVAEHEARISGTWRAESARRGVTLSQPDCLIAATALTHEATLCTGNVKDFPTRGVSVEHWPAGE